MLRKITVTNINYGGRKLFSVALIRCDTGAICWEPTLFLAYRAKSSLSLATLEAYSQDLILFFNVVLTSSGELDWRDISDEQMTAYIQIYLCDKKRLSEKSITRHVETLKGFFNWAYKVRLLKIPKVFTWGYDDGTPQNAAVDIGSKYVSREDFDELLAAINSSDSYIIERDELILSFGYFTGTRAAEVVDPRNFNIRQLQDKFNEVSRKSCITFDLQVVGKGNKIRTIVITPELFERLKKFIFGRRARVNNGSLFCDFRGNALNRQHASKVFKNCKSLCGVGAAYRLRDKTYHCLRHTFATNLVTYCYENNRDPWLIVPERMGHANKATTIQYVAWEAYINNRIDIVKNLSLGDARKFKRDYKTD